MIQRALKASKIGIEKAQEALIGKVLTYQGLAKELSITRKPVENFFKGEKVERQIFVQICENLKLNWQEIAIRSEDAEPDLDDKEPQDQLLARSSFQTIITEKTKDFFL